MANRLKKTQVKGIIKAIHNAAYTKDKLLNQLSEDLSGRKFTAPKGYTPAQYQHRPCKVVDVVLDRGSIMAVMNVLHYPSAQVRLDKMGGLASRKAFFYAPIEHLTEVKE